MNEQNVEMVWKILLAFAGGIFSIAISIAVQQIRLRGIPKALIVTAIIVQLILSWGVFIFMLLFFKSGLLPEAIPNDDWTALLCAYGFSAIPNLLVATAILVYNKEVDKWLRSRYGDTEIPSMNNLEKDLSQEEKKNTKDTIEIEEVSKEHICETCNQTIAYKEEDR